MNHQNSKYWIGFDLGGTKMLAVLFNSALQPLNRQRRKTKSHLGVQAGVDRITDSIEQVLEEAGITKHQLAGIGMGCPGLLDLDKGILLEASNLGWKNAPLKDTLQSHFNCPTIIANDVDAGVFGEYCQGAAQNARCVLGIFPGTGIGGGCVYDGKILHGSNRSCFEIGHIRVQENGLKCSCGQYGCLETVASRLAIAAEAAQLAHRGQAPSLMELAGTDLSKIKSGMLARSIKKGDTAVRELVCHASRHIGVAIGSMIHLLNPEVIVLGGGLVEAMPELILPEARNAANHFILPSFRNTFKIVSAQLGDDATASGAAAWAQKALEKHASSISPQNFSATNTTSQT
jgi:glucokinase